MSQRREDKATRDARTKITRASGSDANASKTHLRSPLELRVPGKVAEFNCANLRAALRSCGARPCAHAPRSAPVPRLSAYITAALSRSRREFTNVPRVSCVGRKDPFSWCDSNHFRLINFKKQELKRVKLSRKSHLQEIKKNTFMV